MLRTKLFLHFAALLVLFGGLSAWYGSEVIQRRVVAEAQDRVRLDLNSAWDAWRGAQENISTVLQLVAGDRQTQDAFHPGGGGDDEVRERLEGIRKQFNLDFLTLVDKDGRVVLRTAPSYSTGDLRRTFSPVIRALRGASSVGTLLMTSAELARESDELPEQAFLVLEDTPKARPTPRAVESRGMVMFACEPVRRGPEIIGAVYAGILLNRNFDLIDQINQALYLDAGGGGGQTGTATVFLQDLRITTTVRRRNGNRAIGTRVSKEVADSVLDNGQSWVGRAFVVNNWYLTAYDPILDLDERTIGMLYVGILEAPFTAMGEEIIWRYIALSAAVVLLALIVAFLLANRLSRPIHRLVGAAQEMHRGTYPASVDSANASTEVANLIVAFNEMVASLREREKKLNDANASLHATNRNYMETLSFVTHELNNPVASMMNYAYLLKTRMIGDLNEKQRKAVRVIDENIRRLTEMIRSYLNLARIERNELRPSKIELKLEQMVITPLLDTFEPALTERNMRIERDIQPGLALHADTSMIREVFDNLLSNAIKYGRAGGAITISAQGRGDFAALAVRNEGEGIPPTEIGKLFQRFSRLEKAPANKGQKGTGLGLFISRHIIDAHGGEMSVTSEFHRWVEFHFTLPMYIAGVTEAAAGQQKADP